MRVVRMTTGSDPRYAVEQENSSRLVVLKGDPLYQQVEPSGQFVDYEDVRLLSPVIPRSKVVAVAKNYHAHAEEMGGEVPQRPMLFFKPNTAVIGPDDPIVLPAWSDEVHYEAELAVVIKTLCRDVKASDYRDVVFGYTVANDVSARDAQRNDGQWARAKGFDTSCPLGPAIVVDPDFLETDRQITTHVNGELVQSGSTRDMVFKVPELIEYVSAAFTLLPGDVILTGTPMGVGPIEAGDRVECSVEGIGTLANPVVRR